jgi:hypothetical protein
MLEGLKRLFSGGRSAGAAEGAWDDVEHWAQSRQYTMRVVQGEGFVIDGSQGGTPWRLEWGPSQRPYVKGQELRLRAELGLASDLQVVLMNRPLQEQMEKAVFEQYVEGVQTRIDNQTPPEMRWLVMFPRLSGQEMGVLRERFVAIASIKSWLLQWLEGPLSEAFSALRVDAATPLVLMIGRGRLMLRTSLPEADLAALRTWLRVFETALAQARRVGVEAPESLAPSTHASLWTASALPDDDK